MPEDLTRSPWYAFAKAVRHAVRELDRIEAIKKREQERRTPGGQGRA